MKKKLLPVKGPVLPYSEFVEKVNLFSWKEATDLELKKQLQAAVSDLPKLYSLLKEIIYRCMGLSLFDTQISAAYSMQQGHIAELPTGEGKTLSAVITAIGFALQGKAVHVLVFNDYLAKRDCISNLPIFTFCGLSAGYIEQKSDFSQRKKAYNCNIVYLSAKEAGFDYLRDFLCETKEALLFPGFQVAIVDEADSILIDEARIPLVLAGDMAKSQDDAPRIDYAVSLLKSDNVIVEKSDHQVWLTDEGIDRIEQCLHLNLYQEENTKILALVNFALEAHFLLEKDKDYIVKDSVVQVVDEPTGRVAQSRKFPDLLHRAIEVKEHLKVNSQTMIFNSMTLQSILLHYPTLCGMTGTIATSAKEVKSTYGLKVDVIPPHIPCIRIDHPDEIFETDKAKCDAILREIQHAYGKGQPVLLGTQSVSESEQYSKMLTALNLPHCVLNARNDELEAEIVARAGEPNRITVSTNMAGRGVDIRLGGSHEEKRSLVQRAGGLYVISTGINRSLRVDNQLRGRGGRQGDPGESRFFISMEGFAKSTFFSAKKLREALKSDNRNVQKQLRKIVRQTQKAIEGEDAEARYMLQRYAYILERQRKLITAYRTELLLGTKKPTLFQTVEPQLYKEFIQKVGEIGCIGEQQAELATCHGVEIAERQLTLYFINQHWADYLTTMESVRNGIHLVVIGKKDPLDEYQRFAIAAFNEMEEDIKRDVVSSIQKYKITPEGINMEEAGLKGATTTWTYMIDESRGQFSRIPQIVRTFSTSINETVFTLGQLLGKMAKLFKK